MTNSLLKSLLLLAIILPFYVANLGVCACGKCDDPNPCTPACYTAGVCPDPAVQYLDGIECGSGYCLGGSCTTPRECVAGGTPFINCLYPMDGSGVAGVCIDGHCVAAANDDCVRPAVGRINCCTPAGCQTAYGARCDPNEHAPDGEKCDPAGIYPLGHANGTGQCQAGYCVVSGCAPPPAGSASLGECVSGQWSDSSAPSVPLNSVTLCLQERCLAGGICDAVSIDWGYVTCASPGYHCGSDGRCALFEPCDFPCDDGNPCTDDSCNWAKVTYDHKCPDQICCDHEPVQVSTPCEVSDGAGGTGGTGTTVPGVCDHIGKCVPIP